jgi:hypothetical protein
MKTAELIASAKRCANITSDYALSKRLDTKPTTVGNWSRGVSFPDTRFTVQLADMAGLDPLKAIADVEIERAEKTHSEDAASFWRRRFGAGAATAAAMILGTVLSSPTPSNAAPSQGQVNNNGSVYTS